MIPLLDLKAQYLSIKDEIKASIDEVLESQKFILGPKVTEFEAQIAKYCAVENAIGVASGSDALLLALMAIDIKPGDEVITTPYTFFATAGAIARLSAVPVFVDIEPKTYNINPALIESKITSKTKAIIPVHLYGQSADMDPILDIAAKHKLFVIEDAAQSLGAKYKNQMTATLGDFGIFSFFPSKNLGGIGDGGMVVAKNKELADKVRLLRVHGSKPKYYHSLVGVCSRLDSVQAAVLNVKLKYLDQWSKKRRENAERYNQLFSVVSGVQTPYVAPENIHIYNQYIIRVKRRDELKKFLSANQIETEIYYPLPLHLQECFKSLGQRLGSFPVSEQAANETLGLPIYPELTETQQKEVVGVIKKFISNQS